MSNFIGPTRSVYVYSGLTLSTTREFEDKLLVFWFYEYYVEFVTCS